MSEYQTFFNVITLPEGREDEALEAWKAVGRFMEGQEGFVGSTLYRNHRDPRMLINLGKYTSTDSFIASIRSEEFDCPHRDCRNRDS